MSGNARSDDIESAFHPKTDIARRGWKVRSVPRPDIEQLRTPARLTGFSRPSADRMVVYLTRRNVVTFVPPTDAWSVQDISLPVYDVSGRFCSLPVQAGHVPDSTWSTNVFSTTE